MHSYMHIKQINYVQCSKFPVEQISSNCYSACTDWSIQSYARGPQCNAERSQASFIGCVTGKYMSCRQCCQVDSPQNPGTVTED